MKLIRHETPESIVCAYLGASGVEELTTHQIHGTTDGNDERVISPDEMVESITEMGFWGYANKRSNEVHAWVSAEADERCVIGFLAHEIGHNTGKQRRDLLKEEARADEYRFVTERAFDWLRELRHCSL
jgi:hypothetical protein